jgi:hypothetical protein
MDWVERLERWFERAYRIRPIGEGGYIFRLGLVRHRGPRLVFRDGTAVNPGDLVGELHIDNRRAAGLHAGGRGGLRFRREVFRLLPVLARDLVGRPEYREINAVCGASLFWAEAERAGFEHRPLPALTRWWLTWWERYLLARYHPAGRRRLAEGSRTELRQVWMTRRTLLERYGGDAGPAAGAASGGSPEPPA